MVWCFWMALNWLQPCFFTEFWNIFGNCHCGCQKLGQTPSPVTLYLERKTKLVKEQESGDGTNLCVSFGGELLLRAEELLKAGLKLRRFIDGRGSTYQHGESKHKHLIFQLIYTCIFIYTNFAPPDGVINVYGCKHFSRCSFAFIDFGSCSSMMDLGNKWVFCLSGRHPRQRCLQGWFACVILLAKRRLIVGLQGQVGFQAKLFRKLRIFMDLLVLTVHVFSADAVW